MIVVTTPSGQIGRHVVRSLLANDAPMRLIVRDPAKLPEDVRERAEIVRGSHADQGVIDRALDGADALFWLVPPDVTKSLEAAYIDFTRPVVQAIRKFDVKRVVSVTALGRGTPWQDKAGLVTTSIQMDNMLMETGAAFRGLAMPSFMDNLLRQAAGIRDHGMFFGPTQAGKKEPTTATRDMGEVAARFLADEGWGGQEELPVLGPEDLSMSEMAGIISDVLGREVNYQQTSFEAFKAQLIGGGVSESFAQGYVEMMQAKDEGMDLFAARNAATRTPTTFRDWCETELRPAVLS